MMAPHQFNSAALNTTIDVLHGRHSAENSTEDRDGEIGPDGTHSPGFTPQLPRPQLETQVLIFS
jgi:hypothetical protein